MTTDFADLLQSWRLQLTAQHKSPKTIKHYIGGVQAWLRWAETAQVEPTLTKPCVQEFITALFQQGAQAGTARARYASLRSFSAWLVAEGEIKVDIFKTMTPPQLDTKITDPLTDAELKDLIKTCSGNSFRDKRDQAIIRLMAETGMRAAECTSLTTGDVDLLKCVAVVRRGKGAKGRVVPFGTQTAAALDKYRRARSAHKLVSSPDFWLGERSNQFGYTALYRAIIRRAKAAGIEDCHPHRFRHTAATRWLRAGGSEGGLMAMAGWSSREMIDRYTAASASERAADEARRLNLGEI
jgi:integrase/recombinase XerD